MPRHTSFRFCLDPSVEQERVLSRHVGAARFAFNQALRLHRDARTAARHVQGADSTSEVGAGVVPDGDRPGVGDVPGAVRVPWTGFDLINSFNTWKRSEAAGRRFLVDAGGMTRVGPVTNAHRQNTPTRPGSRGRGDTGLDDVGTNRPRPRPDWTPEKGGVSLATQLLKHAVGCPP
ncbi:helix-turn-helix domain-containing protein [Promicromonospora soli]